MAGRPAVLRSPSRPVCTASVEMAERAATELGQGISGTAGNLNVGSRVMQSVGLDGYAGWGSHLLAPHELPNVEAVGQLAVSNAAATAALRMYSVSCIHNRRNAAPSNIVKQACARLLKRHFCSQPRTVQPRKRRRTDEELTCKLTQLVREEMTKSNRTLSFEVLCMLLLQPRGQQNSDSADVGPMIAANVVRSTLANNPELLCGLESETLHALLSSASALDSICN